MTPNDIDLPAPAESTRGGRDDARRALEESKRADTASNEIIEASASVIGVLRELRQENHYAEKFRAIIRGGHRAAS